MYRRLEIRATHDGSNEIVMTISKLLVTVLVLVMYEDYSITVTAHLAGAENQAFVTNSKKLFYFYLSNVH